MKKVIFFLAFFAFAGLSTVSAQSSDTKAKTSCTKTAKVCSKTAAATAAAMDENIEQRTCAMSGTVSYVRKNVCPMSGKVSYAQVEYSSESKQFVSAGSTDQADLSEMKVEDKNTDKKACSKAKKGKKGCCAKKGKSKA